MTPRAVLIGLPGSGKTTCGRRLARRLGVGFADSDELVESLAGCTISEIFAREGESAFRDAEARAIAEALSGFDGVMALGGGAVTTASTRRLLAGSGVPVVLLRARLDTLVRRVGRGADRPLLAGRPRTRIAELAGRREPLYRQVATMEIDTDGLSRDRVAAALQERLAAVVR